MSWATAPSLRPVTSLVALLLLAGCQADAPAEPYDPSRPHDGVDPGRVTLHRLNRAEYDNTVRDLLGTRTRPAQDFPADDVGFGFDNNAGVLSVSPLHLEVYERAASKLAREAVGQPYPEPVTFAVEAEAGEATVGVPWQGTAWTLWSAGAVSGTVQIPVAGRYRLDVRAWANQAGGETARMVVSVDGEEVGTFEVEADASADAGVYSVELESVGAAEHTLEARFDNDFYDPVSGEDRQLIVDRLALVGPLDAPPLEAWPRSRVFVCDPAALGEEACAREIVATFAARAWRRPVTADEVERLMGLVAMAREDGLGFDARIELALRAILMSPHFFFRVELQEAPASDDPERLSGWEIAARLSYFVWSSMPDDELFRAAEAGELDTPEGIAVQVERMLADPKAQALVDNFFGQWLYIRDIDNAFPDPGAFPSFDEPLRAAMREEMERFAATFVFEDRPLTDLLTARETFLNERLAEHYGIEGVEGPEFRRVSLEGTPRRGLLTQAGLLTVLSTPFRTSIVRRGKWVLEQLMCAPPPPPPPGVEGLIENEGGGEQPTSLRDIMEQHRADPVCASCHNLMDPIGFGLENYDGVGRWRDLEAGEPIDSSGELIDGTTFDGALELADVLAADDRFPSCATDKLFIYALGRGPTAADRPSLERITEEFVDAGTHLSDLVRLIATSDMFRFRTGEPEEVAP